MFIVPNEPHGILKTIASFFFLFLLKHITPAPFNRSSLNLARIEQSKCVFMLKGFDLFSGLGEKVKFFSSPSDRMALILIVE